MSPRELVGRWLAAFDAFWFGPTLAWPLALFRILFGLALLGYFGGRLSAIDEYLGGSAGRIPDLNLPSGSPLVVNQPLYLPPLGPTGQAIAVIAFFALCLSFLVGYRTRIAAALLGVWILAATLIDWMSAFAENRSAPLVLLVLMLSPAGAVWSVDHWLARRNHGAPRDGDPRSVLISAWSVRTLQGFFLLWYMSSAFWKLKGGWSLLGSNGVVWAQLQGWYTTDIGWWAIHHVPRWFFDVGEVLTIYLETFAPLWFISRRLRPFAFAVGLALHGTLALTMHNIWTLSFEIVSFYALFLPIGARSAAETASSTKAQALTAEPSPSTS
jgi:hypothetical protein